LISKEIQAHQIQTIFIKIKPISNQTTTNLTFTATTLKPISMAILLQTHIRHINQNLIVIIQVQYLPQTQTQTLHSPLKIF